MIWLTYIWVIFKLISYFLIIYSVCQNLPTLFLRQLTSHKFISIETFLFFHKQSHLYTYNLRHNVQTFEMHVKVSQICCSTSLYMCCVYRFDNTKVLVLYFDLKTKSLWLIQVFYINSLENIIHSSSLQIINFEEKKKMFLILKRSEYQFKNM